MYWQTTALIFAGFLWKRETKNQDDEIAKQKLKIINHSIRPTNSCGKEMACNAQKLLYVFIHHDLKLIRNSWIYFRINQPNKIVRIAQQKINQNQHPQETSLDLLVQMPAEGVLIHVSLLFWPEGIYSLSFNNQPIKTVFCLLQTRRVNTDKRC